MTPYSFLLILLFPCSILFGQEKTIKVSENLILTQLNKNTYIHTADNSNGMVYIVENEAVIISTPPTDSATLKLLNYIQNTLNAKVTACIADHWHHDAMEGIDILHSKGIPTYSYILTQQIAKSKNLPEPKNTFTDSLVLSLGDKKIIARYFGPSHSADDIVVWLPNERILFGSCGVKSKGGWVGNIADTHLGDWSTTIEKVKATYPNAKTVVPGHGKHGDTSLLTYTINMFDFPQTKPLGGYFLETKNLAAKNNWSFKIIHDSILEPQILEYRKLSIVYINKDSTILRLLSNEVLIDTITNTFSAKEGSLFIIDKKDISIMTDYNFKNLTLKLRDDEPRMTMVIKEFVFK